MWLLYDEEVSESVATRRDKDDKSIVSIADTPRVLPSWHLGTWVVLLTYRGTALPALFNWSASHGTHSAFRPRVSVATAAINGGLEGEMADARAVSVVTAAFEDRSK